MTSVTAGSASPESFRPAGSRGNQTSADLSLIPASDVVIDQERMTATSAEPWLRFASPSLFAGMRYVELTYRASLYDDPVRPVLRFVTRAGTVEHMLPAPVAGAGIWRGAVPTGVREILISPVTRAGRFDFAVESIRRLSLRDRLHPVWQRRRATFFFVLLRMGLGFHADAANAIDWTAASEPLATFPSWQAVRARAFDSAGFDAPRFDWNSGPRFAVLVHGDGADPAALARTIELIRKQVYPHCRLLVRSPCRNAAELIARIGDPRIVNLDGQSAPDGAAFDVADFDGVDSDGVAPELHFIGQLQPGDELVPHALACFAEEIYRSPAASAFYADEMIRDDAALRPSFKPNWSPLFELERPYLGGCVFVRANALDPSFRTLGEDQLRQRIRAACFAAPAGSVIHLRRWLGSRSEPQAGTLSVPEARRPPPPQHGATVSIIIPTRDRADLIGPCLDSVLQRSTHRHFEVLIVDNGTRQPAALEVLQRASADPRVRIVTRPGRFSFAQLNNDAAALASGDVLVLLNNDTVVLTDDWLEQLADHAVDPAAGAVGARLLFPDGRIQHAGVVVGIGQDAGHFGAHVPEGAPSWLDRSDHLHEVSAVTAACMAVERHKFVAVGGFDSVNLPVELNDIDLCLRLAERHWQIPVCPASAPDPQAVGHARHHHAVPDERPYERTPILSRALALGHSRRPVLSPRLVALFTAVVPWMMATAWADHAV